MDTINTIKSKHEARKPNDTSIVDLYQSLSTEEARQLGRFAVDLLDRKEDRQAKDILRHLACLAPGGLQGIHKDLLDRQQYYPGILFRNADAESRDRIIDSIPATERLTTNHLLLALAWIGDGKVQQTFQAWRDDKPGWVSSLYVPPEAYAQEAGWELLPNGQRRDLFFHQCYPLVKSQNDDDREKRPVKVSTNYQGHCQWCDRELVALLDLAQAVLAFLSIKGERLRIATCEMCTGFGFIFTKVDWKGRAKWSRHNTKPSYLPDSAADWGGWSKEVLVLGEQPRDPFIAASYFLPVSFSQLGGHPTWIQDAEYPKCPSCRNLMTFLGQVAAEDIDEYGEGIFYAFLCSTCGVACTHFQQT